MKWKLMGVAMVVATMNWTPALAEADFNEAWHACDEAATDEGFAEAALPDRSLGYSQETVVRQMGGPHKGQDLITISMPTQTGTVFCQLTTSYEVLIYKFNGREIIGPTARRS